MDCLFCKIVAGDIPCESLYEDDDILAFRDIDPKAPEHILIIPKKHIATVNDVKPVDTLVLGNMMQTAKKIAEKLGVSEQGYRLVMNCNEMGGQAVYHIHLHLLAGRQMHWPAG